MIGKCIDEYTFKKSDQVITMAQKTAMHIEGEYVQVDPMLLFHYFQAQYSTMSSLHIHQSCLIPLGY